MIERFFYTAKIPLVKNQLNNFTTISGPELYHYNKDGQKKQVLFRPNFPMVVQNVCIATGHGIINEKTTNSVSIIAANTTTSLTQLVPFFPAEIPVGKTLDLPNSNATECILYLRCSLGVSMVNLPDVLDGEELDVTVSFTAELDQNAFFEVV